MGNKNLILICSSCITWLCFLTFFFIAGMWVCPLTRQESLWASLPDELHEQRCSHCTIHTSRLPNVSYFWLFLKINYLPQEQLVHNTVKKQNKNKKNTKNKTESTKTKWQKRGLNRMLWVRLRPLEHKTRDRDQDFQARNRNETGLKTGLKTSTSLAFTNWL